MERSIRSTEELKEEGEKIAEKLGNGVTYQGPWFRDNDEKIFAFHTLTDAAGTGTTFAARTLEEAKQKLIKIRNVFDAPLPNFQHLEPSNL